MNTSIVAGAIAIEIQSAVIRNVVNSSDVSLANLSDVIQKTITDLICVHSTWVEQSGEMGNPPVEYKQEIAAAQFARQLCKDKMAHIYTWNPNPQFPGYRRDELSFAAINLGKVSRIIRRES